MSLVSEKYNESITIDYFYRMTYEVQNLEIASIWVYPIKSLPGISVQQAFAGERGLSADRRYMLVDTNNKLISLREKPEFYDFNVRLEGDEIVVAHPDMKEPCRLSIKPITTSGVSEGIVTVWDSKINAIEPSLAASEWFSEVLGDFCKLVYMPDSTSRLISEKWRTQFNKVSFADGYPYLIVSEESRKELAEETGMRLDMKRFRPNLVISGAKAFDEFYWKGIKIGDTEITGLKPCARCSVTTIDPETQAAGKEPLLTLSRRKIDGKVVFGQHAAIKKPGEIGVGDEVTILTRKESPNSPL